MSKQTRLVLPEHGIASITLDHFKSFESSGRIPFGPLTVLAGANSSGKSSLMQPLLLLKQTVTKAYGGASLKLDGPHVIYSEPASTYKKRR